MNFLHWTNNADESGFNQKLSFQNDGLHIVLIDLKRAYTIKTNEYLKMICHSASQLQCYSILNVIQIYIEHMLKHNETKNYCHLTMSQSTDLQIALPQQKLIDRHMRMIISCLYNGFCYALASLSTAISLFNECKYMLCRSPHIHLTELYCFALLTFLF